MGWPRMNPADLRSGWNSHIPEPDPPEECPECDGLGVVPDGEDDGQTCPTCKGAGFYEEG